MTFADVWPPIWLDRWGAPSGLGTGDDGFAPDFTIDFRWTPSDTPTFSPEQQRRRWAMFARDGNKRLAAPINDFKTATLTPRWGRTGQWHLELPAHTAAADVLNGDQAGIVVTRDGTIFFSGPVRARDERRDGDTRTLTVDGPCDLQLLADRVAMPEPQTAAPPYNIQPFDQQVGVASTVMFHYVAVNAGPSAVSQRRVPGLVLGPNNLVGGQVSTRARFQQLDTLLGYLGAQSNPEVGFRCLQRPGNTGEVQFDIMLPRDLTKAVVLSTKLRNILSYEIGEQPGPGNHDIVGGSGTLLSRNILEVDDSAAAKRWGRIETFTNHSDAQSLQDMRNAAQADLTANATNFTIAVVPTDSFAARWGLPVELGGWDLGDKVTVITDAGVVFTDVFREVEVVLDKDVATITPHVESNSGQETRLGATLASAVRRLQDDVAKLETNE